MPDKWTQAHGDCGGSYQSPINVVTKKTVEDKRLTAFQFDNYQQIFRGTIKNNGHSGEAPPTNKAIAALRPPGEFFIVRLLLQFRLAFRT